MAGSEKILENVKKFFIPLFRLGICVEAFSTERKLVLGMMSPLEYKIQIKQGA
jgi:hypothetical protein